MANDQAGGLNPSFHQHPYLLLTLAILFWSGNFIVGRAVHAEVPPVGLAFWRCAGASLLVLGPAWKYLRKDLLMAMRHWEIMLLLSVLGIAAFNTLVYTGLQTTQALNAFLLQSLMPVLIVALSFLLFKEKITSRQAVGVALSLCGAVAIIIRGSLSTLAELAVNQGDLLVLIAVVCYAGYSVLLRKRPPMHPLSFVALTFIAGTLLLLPLYLFETVAVQPMRVNLPTLLAVGYVAVFPSILSYLCYNRGVEQVGANRGGLFIHLMPVFGSIMAILFLGESLRWFHGLGIMLIAAGIFLATRGRR